MNLDLRAAELFDGLRNLSAKPLGKKATMDLSWFGSISFPTDEEAHNDDLQAAAGSLADALLALVEAAGRKAWGKPDYQLTCEDEESPAWTEDLLTGAGFIKLVGWRRNRTKVAFACYEQEDREIPMNIMIGVVPWRAGKIERM